MRKRVPIVVGGGIALLVASQFLDFGLGFRDGSGPLVSMQSDPSPALPENRSSAPSQTDNQPFAGPSAEAIDKDLTPQPIAETIIAPDVVDVLIDGDQYKVVTNAAAPQDREIMSLNEVVEAAQKVTGEPSGIVIRVSRTPTAIAVLETSLVRQLRSAGLTDDQIDQRRQLVDE